jgi:hypothetical protein
MVSDIRLPDLRENRPGNPTILTSLDQCSMKAPAYWGGPDDNCTEAECD